jgi:hypothetical protein
VSDRLTHTARLWLWAGEGNGSWHFLSIDGEAAETIRAHEAMRRLELGKGRGFGSVKVAAAIGKSRWTTSVFPSAPHKGYVLPVKAAVRKAEGIAAGDMVEVVLELL